MNRRFIEKKNMYRRDKEITLMSDTRRKENVGMARVKGYSFKKTSMYCILGCKTSPGRFKRTSRKDNCFRMVHVM